MACSAEEVDKHEAIRGFRGAWRMAWRMGGDKRRGRQCISATHVLRLEQMHFQIEFRLKTRTTQNSQYYLRHWKNGVFEKYHTATPSLKVN